MSNIMNPDEIRDHVRRLMAMDPEEREQLLRSEAARLRTYDSGLWPNGDLISPSELAAAGFYYTGVQDRVQCAFCRGVLRNWERGDNAMNEHRLHFSYCRYVMGLDCGNIPLNNLQGLDNGTNLIATANVLAGLGNAFLPGVSTAKPKHAEYSVEARRLQSFRSWPSWALQSPDALAKAGFYYVGFGDNVKCFFCDGGLLNWNFDDSPWDEHARNYPQCEYLLSIKGKEFVDKLQQKEGPIASMQAQVVNKSCNTNGESRDPRSTANLTTKSHEHRSVQLIQRLGYSLQEIEAVLNSHFPGHAGGTFPSSTDLLNAILQSRGEASPQTMTFSNADKNYDSREIPSNSSVRAAVTATVPPVEAPCNQRLADSPAVKPLATPAKAAACTAAAIVAGVTQRALPLKPLQELTLVGLVDITDEDVRIAEEVRQMKKHLECKACNHRRSEMVLLPCGHMASCAVCVPSLLVCPLCKVPVRGSIRTYLC